MRDIADQVKTWRSEGRQVAIVRVTSIDGFGSRRLGECLAVCESGERAGGILNGAADTAVDVAVQEALQNAKASTIRVPIGDTEAVEAGLACGGSATLSVLPATSMPDSLWSAIYDRTPVVVCTRLVENGTPIVVGSAGSLGEHVGQADGAGAEIHTAIVDRAVAILDKGRPQSTVEAIGGESVHFELVVPIPHLLVVGVANLSDALHRLGQFLGWTVQTRDERVAAEAETSVTEAARLGPTDALVVLSHDLAASCAALAAALNGRCGYVGALGSRHTQAARAERLRESHQLDAGVTDRIHGPVGLDLGSRTPEETALAIFAEIFAERSGRSAASLRASTGPING